MANQIRITLTSFLAYAIMAGMLSQIGIMIEPMAEHFGKQTTEIASQFSWLTVSILVGSVVSLGIFDFVRIKVLNNIAFTAIIVATAGFYFVDDYQFTAVFLAVIGLSCGIALPAAALVISRSYEASQRAPMLVITDASFSLSGALCSAIAVYYLSVNLSWSSGFTSVTVIAAVSLLLSLISSYPEVTAAEKQSPLVEIRDWPISIFACMAALFVYLFGQNFILIWLPAYAQSLPQVSAEQAGNLVSNFWTGMFAGQLLVALILIKVRVSNISLIACSITLLATLPLWQLKNIEYLSMMTFVWGVLTLGLLKLILSWASEMVNIPGPRLISMLLLCATLGTALSPAASSYLVQQSSMVTALMVGSGCFFVVLCLLIFARLRTQ